MVARIQQSVFAGARDDNIVPQAGVLARLRLRGPQICYPSASVDRLSSKVRSFAIHVATRQQTPSNRAIEAGVFCSTTPGRP